MVKLAVINLRTLIKNLLKVILVIVIVAISIKVVKLIFNSAKTWENNFSVDIIRDNLNFVEDFKPQNQEDIDFKKILVSEFALFSGAEQKLAKEEQDDEIELNDVQDNVVQTLDENQVFVSNDIVENVETKIIEDNNKKDVYTDYYNSVQIKNESKYLLTEEMLVPNVSYSNNKDMIIYHTHTCESYTPTENCNYVSTGNYRTTDLEYSVARVGTEFANHMENKGYNVIHDTTYHDYPAYTGSYTRSLSTITNLLNTYETVDCVLDIHRDAIRKY